MTQIWTPPTAHEPFTCHCGETFGDHSALVRHVTQKCIRRHGDEIQAQVAERERELGPLDPEAWRWGRKRESEGKPGFRNGRPA